jgi:hypothetical protein
METGTTTTAGTSAVNHSATAIIAVGTVKGAAVVIAVAADRAAYSTTASYGSSCSR